MNFTRELVPGTGDWLLSDPRFQDWHFSRNWLLWISGGPGHGKSHLATRIIRHLADIFPQDQEMLRTTVAYFFCRETSSSRQSFSTILRSIAYQIARKDLVYAKFLQNAIKSEDMMKCGLVETWERCL